MVAFHVSEETFRKLAVVPIVLLLACAGIVGYNYARGSLLHRDIDLQGGVQLLVESQEQINPARLESNLKSAFGTSDIRVRLRSDSLGNQLGIQIEAGLEDADLLEREVESELGFDLNDENRSITHFGSALAASFWAQAQKAIIFACILMSVVIVFAFRRPVLFGAIMLNVVADMVSTVALMSLLSIKLSLASIAALLMILGYGVDSNILLCTRAFKEKYADMVTRINDAMKTGLTMTLTTVGALAAILVFAQAEALRTIATVLIAGLVLDTIYTWTMNVNILLRAKK